MMYTVLEQVTFIIHFIILGMFGGIMYSVVDTILIKSNLKKVFKVFLEIIFWIILTLIFMKYMLDLADGYLPIYTFLFYLVGVIIHFTLMEKRLRRDVEYILDVLNKIFKKLKKIMIVIVVPIEVINKIKKITRKGTKNEKNTKENNDSNNDVIGSNS